jgi:hypothetical protein
MLRCHRICKCSKTPGHMNDRRNCRLKRGVTYPNWLLAESILPLDFPKGGRPPCKCAKREGYGGALMEGERAELEMYANVSDRQVCSIRGEDDLSSGLIRGLHQVNDSGTAVYTTGTR